MQKYLIIVLKFIIYQVIILLILLLIFLFYNKSNSDKTYTLSSNITDVYLGDSHIAMAVDDKIVENGVNLAKNSEPYYITYYKLEKLIQKNKGIERIHLGYSYHNLSKYYDRTIAGDLSLTITPRYFYLLPFKEESKVLIWNTGRLNLYINRLFKYEFKKVFLKNFHPSVGGYSNNYHSVEAKDVSIYHRIKVQYHNQNELFSYLNISYLYKIIELCENNDIELILLNTPLYSKYQNNVPDIYKRKLENIVSKNKHRIRYQNLSEYFLEKHNFTPDGDHLSKTGAIRFSEYLNSR